MDIEKNIQETINQNKLIQVNEKIYLSYNQIEVLKKYKIPFKNCTSINEIIFYIEELLEENEYEDLENISQSLAEFDYYKNYKK